MRPFEESVKEPSDGYWTARQAKHAYGVCSSSSVLMRLSRIRAHELCRGCEACWAYELAWPRTCHHVRLTGHTSDAFLNGFLAILSQKSLIESAVKKTNTWKELRLTNLQGAWTSGSITKNLTKSCQLFRRYSRK